MSQVKKSSRFLSMGHRILPSCGCKARETMVTKCELVLWGTSPVDEIHLIGPLKQYLAGNISFQKSNCNVVGLKDIVALFANEARFFRFRVFFRACSLQNEVGDRLFFYISDTTYSSSYSGNSLREKSMLENFRANVLKGIDSAKGNFASCDQLNILLMSFEWSKEKYISESRSLPSFKHWQTL